MREVDTHESVPEEQTLTARRIKPLKVFLRIGVGGALIAILVWRSDVNSIVRALARARPGYIGAAAALMLTVILVSSFRWRVFLRRLGFDLRVPTLIRLYFVGSFFNVFLPTGVGGDAYKAIRLRRGPGTLAAAFASVLLDRFAGIVALAGMGVAAAVARFAVGDREPVVWVAAVIASAILGATALLLAGGERIVGTGRSTWFGLRPRLRRTFGAMATAGRDRRAAWWGALGGLATQALVLASHAAAARALGLDVSIAVLTAGLVIATVAATLPFTVNGLGVREGAWVWSLGAYGVPGSEALAFALLALGVTLTSSAVGGIVYVVSGGEADAAPDRPKGSPG